MFATVIISSDISRSPNNTPASAKVFYAESYFLHEAVSRSCSRPHASLCLVTVARQRPKLLQAVINISARDWLSSVWDGHFVFSVTRSIAGACSAECRYSLTKHLPIAFLSIASVWLMNTAANAFKTIRAGHMSFVLLILRTTFPVIYWVE